MHGINRTDDNSYKVCRELPYHYEGAAEDFVRFDGLYQVYGVRHQRLTVDLFN